MSNVDVLTNSLSESELEPDLVNRVLKLFVIAAEDVSEAALAVDVAADDFDVLVTKDIKIILDRALISMGELDQTMNAFEGTAGNASRVAVDVSDAINRLSNSGLTDLEETADMLRELVESLNNVIESIEQNPVGFIGGKTRETVELPQ